ncbi:Melanocortin-2 receptor accessory protein [Myotis brandtii]|uniref:Melanocortin-2 receptor accessory protein n=1 Tax=Myotis brandtii TaxID=109478 RepID=S7P2B7_MYOBR|nr:Melanocortin-2 receptor accessory protein [Myotis brandtii]
MSTSARLPAGFQSRQMSLPLPRAAGVSEDPAARGRKATQYSYHSAPKASGSAPSTTANSSNASAPSLGYEYYLDYLDLLPVDEKQLRAHKYSVVIAFWVSLAAFVVLLFLVLLSMSRWAPSASSAPASGGHSEGLKPGHVPPESSRSAAAKNHHQEALTGACEPALVPAAPARLAWPGREQPQGGSASVPSRLLTSMLTSEA